MTLLSIRERGWQTLSVTSQEVNVVGFVDHTVLLQ